MDSDDGQTGSVPIEHFSEQMYKNSTKLLILKENKTKFTKVQDVTGKVVSLPAKRQKNC